MMKPIYLALGKLNPNLVQGVMLLLVALLAFEGWMLLLRKPYGDYQKAQSARVALATTLQQSPDQTSALGSLAAELKQLADQLGGELRLPASDDKMAASLMEALDRSSAAHQVTLVSIKPGDRKPVSVFEEVSFEISAKGAYLQLCAWLLAFGKSLGNNATVTEFDMKTADEGKKVTLSLKVALYRPLKTAEVSK